MSGLREYERDESLPALAGDADLCPPSPDRVVALVENAMLSGEHAPAVAARLCHVRWKPHTALAALFEVRFGDGTERLITWKRYASDKAERIAARRPRAGDAHESGFAAWVAWPAERVVMSAFPSDRALPGLARAFDPKRTCRRLRETARFAGANMRQHHSTSKLVRYKPERRAVVRFDAASRDDQRELSLQSVGLRVLPRAQASRVFQARVASGLGALGFAPALVGCDSSAGIVFEEWLDVTPKAHNDFSDASEVGEALARLHGLPCDAVEHCALSADETRDVLALFEVQRGSWSAAQLILGTPSRPASRRSWIHGDFHADQTAREARSGRLRLLDWDGLAAGNPLDDVVSWIADAVAADERDEGAEFLRAYCASSGAQFTEDELDRAVSRALCMRAAAVLRRLEHDAITKAARLLELAHGRVTARGSAR